MPPARIGVTVARAGSVRAGLLAAWTTLLLLSASCGGVGGTVDPYHCRDTYCVGGDMTVSYRATRGTRTVDILLVVDDRVGSSPDGPKLESALDGMMGNLDWPLEIGGNAVDLHVAMVSAAGADASPGAVPSTMWPVSPGCASPSGPFLRATQLCDDSSNFSGSLSEAVKCAALHMAASGETPRPFDTIRAMMAAGGLAKSTGFRRGEVPLIVVIVSMEDDPSLGDSGAVAAAHDLLAGTVSNPEADLLVGAVGPAGAQGLMALAAAFGENGDFSATTDAVWSSLPFTTDVRLAIDGWPGYRDCLDWPLADAQPDVEGIQPDCIGTEIHRTPAERTEEIMPTCPDGAPISGHCWRVVQDPKRCPAGEFEFHVEPRTLACLPSYTIVYSLTCAVRYD